MAIIQRIGEPENASETKAIQHLARVLPADYVLIHNFELTGGGGLPYEYDLAVVGEHAVYHVEVKGYRGRISGDTRQWTFENGAVYPSPIPLANKKTKILASKLQRHARNLKRVWCETVVLLTHASAPPRLKDDQASRVIRLEQAADYFTDPKNLPVRTENIGPLHNQICEALFGARPCTKLKTIGLYDLLARIGQSDTRSVFLAEHRYIKTQPKTILKAFHFDIYAKTDEKKRQIDAIFRDQNALRLLGSHPNIIATGDFFAWDDNKFVLPTEYIEHGRPLTGVLEEAELATIPWQEKIDIIAKTARGLRHAHRNGVVHRDIQPQNIVLGPGGLVKLVNFDLAFLPGGMLEPAAKDVRRRFDVRYCAPEVFVNPESAAPRSDVFSLGAVFFRLLTGRHPYADVKALMRGESVPFRAELLGEALEGAALSGLSGDELTEVIRRMCAIDAQERYQSIEQLNEDLAILTDENYAEPTLVLGLTRGRAYEPPST